MLWYQSFITFLDDIIMATDLSRLPNNHLNNQHNNHIHHMKAVDNQFMGAKNHFGPDLPYPQLKSIMDISNGVPSVAVAAAAAAAADHEANLMSRGGKYFMDFSYRNYYKNLQDIQGGGLKSTTSNPGYEDGPPHLLPNPHHPNSGGGGGSTDYDDGMSSPATINSQQSHHQNMSPAHLQHLQSSSGGTGGSISMLDSNSMDAPMEHDGKYGGGGDISEKGMKSNYDTYMKSFDGTIRAKQLDEMQNCDIISHDANNGGSAGDGGNKLTGDDCGSADARNYASSDDMNQTTSSERDDKIGSGSEDEGKRPTI